MDEALAGIGLAQDRQRVARRGRGGVAGRENAAARRHQMRGEQHLGPGHHLDLGGVAVAGQAVSAIVALDAPVERAVVGRATSAARARRGIDDDPRALDHPRRDQRPQRQAGRGRVATGGGDQLSPGNRVAVEFGQAVDEFADQVGAEVRLAIPVGISLGRIEPEVGAEIDDLGAAADQRVGEKLRFAMGKRGEDQLGTIEQGRVPSLETGIGIGQREVRVKRGDGLSGARRGDQRPCVKLGMRGDQSQQFAADIARRTEDHGLGHSRHMQKSA